MAPGRAKWTPAGSGLMADVDWPKERVKGARKLRNVWSFPSFQVSPPFIPHRPVACPPSASYCQLLIYYALLLEKRR